ncbi:hypothetical protein [Leifsonia aquatica]|uniref:Uncharacterized protein n=2 Tax=Leifsonia aquatica TaxID=144185 RepID=U2T9E8_LEIAQ|nr:hypothetical protein [Leifsonia aquatica]ERK71327.1 hypothetical protein N136_02316 [Leifsonia aquatica ATCC 14665]MBB2967781.1 hypothetical protein [Leifsonia aquatica]
MTKTATTGPTTAEEELGNPLDFHVEVYESTLTHEEILVGCWCPIGRTHTYAEAVGAAA